MTRFVFAPLWSFEERDIDPFMYEHDEEEELWCEQEISEMDDEEE